MKHTLIITLGSCLCLLSGCRKPASPPGTDAEASVLADYEARLARIEMNQRLLAERIENVLAIQRPPPVSSGVIGLSTAMVASVGDPVVTGNAAPPLLEAKIQEMVKGALDERLGDQQTIQAVFEEVVGEEITAREDRKQREQEAEEQRRREEREKERVERENAEFTAFADVLKLTDDQKVAVKAISEQTRDTIRQTMSEMRDDGKFTPKDYRIAFDMIRSNQNERMKQTLSEPQYNTFQEEYEGRIRGAGGMMGGRGFFGGGRRGEGER